MMLGFQDIMLVLRYHVMLSIIDIDRHSLTSQ